MKWLVIKLWSDNPDAGVDVFGRYPSAEECAHAADQAGLEVNYKTFHPQEDTQYHVSPNESGYQYIVFTELKTLNRDNLPEPYMSEIN